MVGIEGGSYKPLQRFEAPPSDRGQGGHTPPGGDRMRLTPEPAEGGFTYPLKPIAQRCLADIRDYEDDWYNLGSRNIQEYIQDSTEQVWGLNPAPSKISSLRHELIENFDFPRVAIPYMLLYDHPFFQGRNEEERFTELDKRILLDDVLVKDSKYCQEQLDHDAVMRAYFPETYLDPDADVDWQSGKYDGQIPRKDIEMYRRNLRVDRQLLRQLRQRGEALEPRKVIPLR